MTRVLANGFAANHDSADFATFDVSVPLATLQSEASATTDQIHAHVDITVITDCDPTPRTALTFGVTLRGATTLMLTPVDPSLTFIANSISTPAQFWLSANREAAGMPVTLSTSQGSITGPSVLGLDNTGNTGAINDLVSLVPDPAKQGNAELVAQAGTVTAMRTILIVGPPVLLPGTSSIQAGKSLAVSVHSSAPPPTTITCVAGAPTGLTAMNNGTSFSTGVPTVLTALDPTGNKTFTVVTDGITSPGNSLPVSCMDQTGQTAAATYSVPKS